MHTPLKPTRIVGLSAFYHDAAAAIIIDGSVIAAAQEERFTRIKFDKEFPAYALQYCLKEAQCSVSDLSAVVFYDKPLLKLERVLETYLFYAPSGILSFIRAMVTYIRGQILFRQVLRRKLLAIDPLATQVPILFSSHHLSHAASCFYPSPFEESAILTIDGVGEWSTTSVSHGTGARIETLQEIHFPHSLGLLYSTATEFLGFNPLSGEQKVMGLASYADSDSALVQKLYTKLTSHVITIHPDGSFALHLEYFEYPVGTKMANSGAWENLLEIAPRTSGVAFTLEHAALARAIQLITEQILLRLAQAARSLTGSDHVCIAGGVALNCVANTVLRDSKIFTRVWIPPNPGDAGGALGAALAAYYMYFNRTRTTPLKNEVPTAYLGPQFTDIEIEDALKARHINYEYFQTPQALTKEIAMHMAQKQIIGWFQGKMEWGPRALGNRSILADPRTITLRDRINRDIKKREGFRPFGASVLAEDAQKYFDQESPDPYMIFTASIPYRSRIRAKESSPGLIAAPGVLSDLPAITHIDFSSRVQTVTQEQNPVFYMLLQEYKAHTGCGVLLNTSLNTDEEPIVCTPAQAIDTFVRSGLDVLAIGSFIALKAPLAAHEK